MKMSEMMTRWCRFELSESDNWTIKEMNLPFMRSKENTRNLKLKKESILFPNRVFYCTYGRQLCFIIHRNNFRYCFTFSFTSGRRVKFNSVRRISGITVSLIARRKFLVGQYWSSEGQYLHGDEIGAASMYDTIEYLKISQFIRQTL